MVDINKQVGARIREWRIRRGLTQEELAHRSELDYSYVNQIENGKRNPSLRAIDRLARALGVTANDLIALSGGEQRPDVAGR